MTIPIRDRLIITILFNGQILPLKLNTIRYIHIVESVRLYLPQLTMEFTDATKFLTRNQLIGDGTLIDIILEKESFRQKYSFRLFSCKDTLDGGDTIYKITAYWNAPIYWSKTISKIYSGSSDSVLETLVSECDTLYFDSLGIATNDAQSWIPMNRTYKEFAKDIVENSYVDDKSCMVMGVTSDGGLRLRNLTDMNSFNTWGKFYSGIITAEHDPITDFQVIGKPGFSNAVSGYQSTSREGSVTGTEQDFSKLNVVRNSQKLSMNTDIKDKISSGRVNFTPINSGNVHANYHKAAYQNERLAGLFSFGLAVVTPKPVAASILDCVTCSITRPELDTVNPYSGRFLVGAKVIYVVGINYYVKMELLRHGTNDKQDASQVG